MDFSSQAYAERMAFFINLLSKVSQSKLLDHLGIPGKLA
jgi:hypothetical protein